MGKLMIGNNIASPVIVNGSPTPSGKYTLLQRISDDNGNEIGTVSGFFTDANGVEYAVVCLDSQYRASSIALVSVSVLEFPTTKYTSQLFWDMKDTSTSETQAILDYCSQNSCTSAACEHCRQYSFVIDGVTYYGQLPNIRELADIYIRRSSIDETIVNGGNVWSSTQDGRNRQFRILDTGGISDTQNKTQGMYVIPVLEIPN